MPAPKINNPKTHHGATKLFAKGGDMATKKFNFEKSSKDFEFGRFGKEGSKKEEAFDKKQSKGMKCGGKVKKMACGGGVAVKGLGKGRIV